MLGWNIRICRQASGGSSPATAGSDEGARLAVWQTDARGLQWLDELVETNRAIDLGGDGYPNYYTAQAEHLIQSIVSGPPATRQTWASGQHDVLTPRWASCARKLATTSGSTRRNRVVPGRGARGPENTTASVASIWTPTAIRSFCLLHDTLLPHFRAI